MGRGRRVGCESPPEEREAEIVVDAQPTALHGRIDRIDVQPSTGRRVIIDYKTSDTPTTPEKAHRKKGHWFDARLPIYCDLPASEEPPPWTRWADLQLPLYRHLVKSLGIEGTPRLAYIVLPKDISEVALLPADWTEADFKDANRVRAALVSASTAKSQWTADDLRQADLAAEEVVRAVRAEKFSPPGRTPAAVFRGLRRHLSGQPLFRCRLVEEEGRQPMSQEKNTVIRALAGTGKTFQLSNRFIGLLAAGQPLDAHFGDDVHPQGGRRDPGPRPGAHWPTRCSTRRSSRSLPSTSRARRWTAAGAWPAAGNAPPLAPPADQHAGQLLHRDRAELRPGAGAPAGLGDRRGRSMTRLRDEAVRLLSRKTTNDVVRLMHLLTKGEATRSVSQQISDLVTKLYAVYLRGPCGGVEVAPPSKAAWRRANCARPSRPWPSWKSAGDKRFQKAVDTDRKTIVGGGEKDGSRS